MKPEDKIFWAGFAVGFFIGLAVFSYSNKADAWFKYTNSHAFTTQKALVCFSEKQLEKHNRFQMYSACTRLKKHEKFDVLNKSCMKWADQKDYYWDEFYFIKEKK